MQGVVSLGGVFNDHAGQIFLRGDFSQHWRQVKKAVGHVVGDDTTAGHLVHEDAYCLLCNQVHRNRVAGKRVNSEHRELVAGLALE